MTVETLALQVRSLEMQLRVLKAQIQELKPQQPDLTTADLFGILSHNGSLSEEEIESGIYLLKPGMGVE